MKAFMQKYQGYPSEEIKSQVVKTIFNSKKEIEEKYSKRL
jgi:hypothetical protein